MTFSFTPFGRQPNSLPSVLLDNDLYIRLTKRNYYDSLMFCSVNKVAIQTGIDIYTKTYASFDGDLPSNGLISADVWEGASFSTTFYKSVAFGETPFTMCCGISYYFRESGNECNDSVWIMWFS